MNDVEDFALRSRMIVRRVRGRLNEGVDLFDELSSPSTSAINASVNPWRTRQSTNDAMKAGRYGPVGDADPEPILQIRRLEEFLYRRFEQGLVDLGPVVASGGRQDGFAP